MTSEAGGWLDTNCFRVAEVHREGLYGYNRQCAHSDLDANNRVASRA